MILWVILVAVEENVMLSVVILVVLRAAAVHFVVVVVLAFGLRHAAAVCVGDVEVTVVVTTRTTTEVNWTVDENIL